MSDLLKREFSAQLATAMDLVQRRAVFEIMKIFENSLHDHQKELLLKGEEIAQLKMQLQSEEMKRREMEGGSGREQFKKPQTTATNKEADDLGATGQTSDVPEIDFEVPDDWCAPVGSENVTKQHENMCPSVRLRRLTIPLWHVRIKQEVVKCDIDSYPGTKDRRRSERGATKEQLPSPQHVTRRPTLRKDMKQLCQDLKNECTDQTGCRAQRGRGMNLKGKKKKGVIISKKTKATASNSKTHETVEDCSLQGYSCKICRKVFHTEFGKSVHERTHKNCKGCKRVFNMSSVLQRHKTSCAKYKKLLARRTQHEKQTTIKKERGLSSRKHSEASNNKDQSAKKQTCVFCNKRMHSRYALKEHMRVHTGEKPFLCTMCPKTFRVNQSLKRHMLTVHKDQGSSEERNGDLAWTMPLEKIEDTKEYSQNKSQAIGNKKIPKNRSLERWSDLQGWQRMGTRCSEGFTCLLCQKLMKSKSMLIEHFRTHTGEKPLKCAFCPARFRYRGQLCLHRKKCNLSRIRCEKCEKTFLTKARYDTHVRNFHKDYTFFCKDCGKGFFMKGCLHNHMKLLHM